MGRESLSRLDAVGGGWVRYSAVDLDADVFLRFEEDGHGRLVPRELHLVTDPGRTALDAAWLRRVPLGRIEASVNSPEMAEKVLLAPEDEFGSILVVTHEGLRDAIRHASTETFRRLSASRSRGRHPSSAGFRITVPAMRPFGDGFYEEVAKVYSLAAAESPAPAKLIAEASKAPIRTVHGWVTEARRRGFLPPGHRGKAG